MTRITSQIGGLIIKYKICFAYVYSEELNLNWKRLRLIVKKVAHDAKYILVSLDATVSFIQLQTYAQFESFEFDKNLFASLGFEPRVAP